MRRKYFKCKFKTEPFWPILHAQESMYISDIEYISTVRTDSIYIAYKISFISGNEID